MANTFAALKNEYATLWQAMSLRPQREAEIKFIFGKLTSPAAKARYQAVEATTGVPWFVIGIIHNLEASRRFDAHLHNGDPLTARTVHVPRNRPVDGNPPFTWEASAKDALDLKGLGDVPSWPVERIAFELERYNGWGYRNLHPHVKSPYLWSFSTIYSSGKYVADHVWSDTAVSGQCGGMTMLRYMVEQGAITLPSSQGAAPQPDPQPPAVSAPAFPGHYLRFGIEDDPHVEVVQRRLRTIGIDPGTINSDFGVNTENAVKMFQARSDDETGEPLEIDGIVGPKTWAMLFKTGLSVAGPIVPASGPQSSLVAALLDIAGDEVGVLEQPPGSNRGPRVDQYIRTAGLDPTQDSFPWCVCFVFWCFSQAAMRVSGINLMPKTAGVHICWQNSQNIPGIRIVPAQAARNNPALIKPGMAFFIDTGGGRGHTGIVAANVNSLLETIEGNTNDGGSREGVGVFRRTRRRIGDINLGFVAYD